MPASQRSFNVHQKSFNKRISLHAWGDIDEDEQVLQITFIQVGSCLHMTKDIYGNM